MEKATKEEHPRTEAAVSVALTALQHLLCFKYFQSLTSSAKICIVLISSYCWAIWIPVLNKAITWTTHTPHTSAQDRQPFTPLSLLFATPPFPPPCCFCPWRLSMLLFSLAMFCSSGYFWLIIQTTFHPLFGVFPMEGPKYLLFIFGWCSERNRKRVVVCYEGWESFFPNYLWEVYNFYFWHSVVVTFLLLWRHTRSRWLIKESV